MILALSNKTAKLILLFYGIPSDVNYLLVSIHRILGFMKYVEQIIFMFRDTIYLFPWQRLTYLSCLPIPNVIILLLVFYQNEHENIFSLCLSLHVICRLICLTISDILPQCIGYMNYYELISRHPFFQQLVLCAIIKVIQHVIKFYNINILLALKVSCNT